MLAVVVETGMVIHGRRGQRAVILMDDLLRLSLFEHVAPGQPEADAAYAAFVACGKGNGHPAGLDFGDVFSCALAKIQVLALLYKGGDFAQTDITSALSVQLSGRRSPRWAKWGLAICRLQMQTVDINAS